MLQYTEEILDYDDLVENNNYYIQFQFTFPNEYAIQFTEKYNGIYKLIKEIIHISQDINRHFYELINESNVTLYLTNYSYTMDNNYKFVCDIRDYTTRNCHKDKYRECRIYKVNETEYILK
jgi:hypothetical protein